MVDRLNFTRNVLDNGITVYTNCLDAQIASMEIQLPIGAAHSHAKNGFLPGSVHFLEHMMSIRSKNFPEAHQLDIELGIRGCHFNANTYRSKTTFWIDCPVGEIQFASQALVDRVFHPVFRSVDIETEKTVVLNERERELFYPGRDRVTQYYYTQFMSDIPYSVDQLYGNREDLDQISPDILHAMHQRVSATNGITAILVGDCSFDTMFRELSQVKLTENPLERKLEDTHWVDRSYRQVAFDTVNRPTLELAWIHQRASYGEKIAIDFILGLLSNPIHGTLHQELRREKGWTYGVNTYSSHHRQSIFGVTIPLSTIEQLEMVRKTFFDRLRKSIHNQSAVEREITRRLNSHVYSYQTPVSIMAAASRDLLGGKKVYTESEWQREIRAMADPQWREDVVKKFFSKRDVGELALIPKR